VTEFEMGGPSNGRLTPLLSWLGLTMVVILVLQMVALLVGVDWSDETTKPQIVGPLVALSPLGLMGLLIALIGSRVDVPERRLTPLRLVVCAISSLLALAIVAVPFSLGADAADGPAAERLEQGRQAIKDARSFRENPKEVEQLGEQLAQAGQLASDASAEDKKRAAETMIDTQIAQMDDQIEKLESQQSRSGRQRAIGGTASAVVLAISFTLLALAAVL
jgi:hypothetical protein